MLLIFLIYPFQRGLLWLTCLSLAFVDEIVSTSHFFFMNMCFCLLLSLLLYLLALCELHDVIRKLQLQQGLTLWQGELHYKLTVDNLTSLN